MTTLTQSQAHELLSDLAAQMMADTPPDIEPDEVTASMLACQTGQPYERCKKWLDEQVAMGQMDGRVVRMKNGRNATAYRRVTR